ncbi:MAG TPA: XRE family transcriptional regulator [Acidimicrobiales bacterium]|nr:XRE family transcriptional regulator [Acidimicrobiales bacterium]
MTDQGPSADLEVGSEIRRRRIQLGLTLREVGEAADLTSGFLSQVENDRVSPSLKSLARIAEVLKVPLFHLLSQPTHDPVVRADNRPVVAWGDRSEIRIELLTPHRDWYMLPFRRVMQPEEVYEAERLEHAREEWLLVESGSIEVELAPDEHHVLGPGDAIHYESSRLRTISNRTGGEAAYICMMSPPPLQNG